MKRSAAILSGYDHKHRRRVCHLAVLFGTGQWAVMQQWCSVAGKETTPVYQRVYDLRRLRDDCQETVINISSPASTLV